MTAPTTSCSAGSAAVGEQLAGSAPYATAWVALEQTGPWGPRAFTDSHLDPDLGRALEDTAAAHGVRPALIRAPGRHADAHAAAEGSDGPDPRRVLVAHTTPGRTWLLEGTVPDPARLLDLDWAALARGDRAAVQASLPGLTAGGRHHLLVCTNGTRDLCCATVGRPVALAAADALPGRVWEVTHTSGHRFAPTSVLLPSGYLHGRLDGPAAVALVEAADRGRLVLDGARGRSTWPSEAQAAELAVREKTGEAGLDALTVAGHEAVAEHSWRTEVRHQDGRRWQVLTEAHESGTLRAESCGKALKPLTYRTVVLEPLDG